MNSHHMQIDHVLQEPCDPLAASLPHNNTMLVHYNHQNDHNGAGVY